MGSLCPKFRRAYGIHFGLKLLLQMFTFKKNVAFSENQNGAIKKIKMAARMNKVEWKKKTINLQKNYRKALEN